MKEIDLSNVSEIISEEVKGDDSETRQKFIDAFTDQIDVFIDAMSSAYANWKDFDSKIGDNKKKAHISSLIYSTINNHIVSMKIFLSGYIVVAGNLQRQVIETMALAILCADSSLDILDRYSKDMYSTNKAVRDVLRNSKKLKLNEDALKVLDQSQDFYHNYSHPTQLTVASLVSFSGGGKLYLGASFDEGKIKTYTKEVESRVSFAKIFDNAIDGIKVNANNW